MKRMYNKAHWLKLRRAVLQDTPLCVYCHNEGIVKAATEVDHIRPHEGDITLMYARDNLQALCHTCHSRKTVEVDGGLL